MNFTSMLEACGHWIWQSSWQAVMLIALVLFAQRIFRERLTPAWRYNLWLLVLARLALPIWPESPWSIFNLTRFPEPARAIQAHEYAPSEPPQSRLA